MQPEPEIVVIGGERHPNEKFTPRGSRWLRWPPSPRTTAKVLAAGLVAAVVGLLKMDGDLDQERRNSSSLTLQIEDLKKAEEARQKNIDTQVEKFSTFVNGVLKDYADAAETDDPEKYRKVVKAFDPKARLDEAVYFSGGGKDANLSEADEVVAAKLRSLAKENPTALRYLAARPEAIKAQPSTPIEISGTTVTSVTFLQSPLATEGGAPRITVMYTGYKGRGFSQFAITTSPSIAFGFIEGASILTGTTVPAPSPSRSAIPSTATTAPTPPSGTPGTSPAAPTHKWRPNTPPPTSGPKITGTR